MTHPCRAHQGTVSTRSVRRCDPSRVRWHDAHIACQRCRASCHDKVEHASIRSPTAFLSIPLGSLGTVAVRGKACEGWWGCGALADARRSACHARRWCGPRRPPAGCSRASGSSPASLDEKNFCSAGQALTQVPTRHGSRQSDSCEDGETLSSVHSTALAAGKLIHNLLCDGHVKNYFLRGASKKKSMQKKERHPKGNRCSVPLSRAAAS